ncbi:MAG: CSLREA domain-containing protein, partial [Acidobacteriota bacterium]
MPPTIVLVLVALVLLAASSLQAIVVTTTADEDGDNPEACALREAVQTLNDQTSFGGCVFTEGDTLVELGAGTYELSLDLGITDGLNLFVPMTLRGQGPHQTTIERIAPLEDDLLTVILLTPGVVTFEGFSIRGATGLFNSAIEFVADSGEELIMRDLVFVDNVARSAPFRFQGNADGIARLDRVVFENNRNQGENSGGGGINCSGDDDAAALPSISLKDVIFRGNVATDEDDSVGGLGASGGGMVSQLCHLTLENVTFDSNSAVGVEADGLGGGLLLFEFDGQSPQVDLSNVTFFNNSAVLGGGMAQFSFINGREATLNQVTFAENRGSGGGDHILQRNSSASLRNVVFGPSPNGACDSNPASILTPLGGNMDSDGTCGVELSVADPGLGGALTQQGGFT